MLRFAVVRLVLWFTAIEMLTQPILLALPQGVLTPLFTEQTTSRDSAIIGSQTQSEETLTVTVPGSLPEIDPSTLDPGAQPADLLFIENVGQFQSRGNSNGKPRFQVRGETGTIWLMPNAIWISLVEPSQNSDRGNPRHPNQNSGHPEQAQNEHRRGVHLKVSFEGANPNPQLEGFDAQPVQVNYLLGNRPSEWRKNVPVWGGVRYVDLYPGVDLEITGDSDGWVWKLVVHPEAAPEFKGEQLQENINLRIEGANAIHSEGASNASLRLETEIGTFNLPGLEVHDESRIPFILPLGSLGDLFPMLFRSTKTSVSRQNLPSPENVVPAPFASSPNDKSFMPSYQTGGGSDILIYSTYFSGEALDTANAVAADNSGKAYITGHTWSTDLPDTTGAYDQTCYTVNQWPYCWDMYIAKFDTTLSGTSSLIYVTYIGGPGHDYGFDIAIDSEGAAYVAGYTEGGLSIVGGFDSSVNSGADATILKLAPSGSSLEYSTYIGPAVSHTGISIAVEEPDLVYIAGDTFSNSYSFPITLSSAFDTDCDCNGDPQNSYSEIFISKIDTSITGSGSLVYSTYLGGSLSERYPQLALGGDGVVYVTGLTESEPDFPLVNEFDDELGNSTYTDVFISKLDTTVSGSSGLLYSTYLGGSQYEAFPKLAVIPNTDKVYVVAGTWSSDLPVTSNAYRSDYVACDTEGDMPDALTCDLFLSMIDTSLSGTASLEYLTYLGGSKSESPLNISTDTSGNVYLLGAVASADFEPSDWLPIGPSFIGKFNPEQNEFEFFSYLPTPQLGSDLRGDVVISADGYAYIASTAQTERIITKNAYQDDPGTGYESAVLTKLALAPNLLTNTGGPQGGPINYYTPDAQRYVGNPINTSNGNQTYQTLDLQMSTPAGGLFFSRSYSTFNAYYNALYLIDDSHTDEREVLELPQGTLSAGWYHNYESRLLFCDSRPCSSDTDLLLIAPNGAIHNFRSSGPNTYLPLAGTGGRINKVGTTYIYTSDDGIKFTYYDTSNSLLAGRLYQINYGYSTYSIQLNYNTTTGRLETVSDTTPGNSQELTFTYTDSFSGHSGRLQTVELSNDQSVSFDYNVISTTETGYSQSLINLAETTDVRGQTWEYKYVTEDSRTEHRNVILATFSVDNSPYLWHFLEQRLMPLTNSGAERLVVRYRYSSEDYEDDETPNYLAYQEVNGTGDAVLTIDYPSAWPDSTLVYLGALLDDDPLDAMGPTLEYLYSGGRLISEGIVGQDEKATWTYFGNARPHQMVDANGRARYTTWTPNGAVQTVSADPYYLERTFVSPSLGLNLPELVFYPSWVASSQNAAPTRTLRLIYNTPTVVDPAYWATDGWTVNPYGTASSDNPLTPGDERKPYPYLPETLLVARIDNSTGPGLSFQTNYHYYTSGSTAGLVKCVDVPTPGGDTCYNYNDRRQVITIAEYVEYSTSTGTWTGGMTSTLVYDPTSYHLDTIEDASGDKTKYLYVGESDLPAVVIKHYNPSYGWLTQSGSNLWNVATAYFYDNASRLVGVVENYDPSAFGTVDNYEPADDNTPNAYQFNFDNNTSTTDPWLVLTNGSPHKNRATVYRYDAASRVTETITNYHPDKLPYEHGDFNFSTLTVYDRVGRVAATVENYQSTQLSNSTFEADDLDLNGDGVAETPIEVSPDYPDRNLITLYRYNSLGRLQYLIAQAWPVAQENTTPLEFYYTVPGRPEVIYNRVTAYEYDPVGNITTTILNYDPLIESSSTTYDLDVELDPGHITPLIVDPAQPDRNQAICITYDAINRPTFVRAACVDDNDYIGGGRYNLPTYYSYDEMNRPIVIVENYRDTNNPAPTSIPGSTVILAISSQYNHVTRLYYDGLGRLEWSAREFVGNAASPHLVLMDDPSILNQPDHNLITRYFYHANGLLVAKVDNYREDISAPDTTDPDTALVEADVTGGYPSHNLITRYFYNNAGLITHVVSNYEVNLTSEPNGLSSSSTLVFNASNVVFDENAPDKDLITSYPEYDPLYRPTEIVIDRGTDTDPTHQIVSTRTFDNLGRLLQSTFDEGVLDQQTTYAYGLAGYQIEKTDPAGRGAKITLDVRGNPTYAIDPANLNLTAELTYDLFGNLIQSGASRTDGITQTVDTFYDPLGQPLSTVRDDGGLELTTSYTYNLNGQMLTVKQQSAAGDCRATAYKYDNLGRLTQVTENYTSTSSEGCTTSQTVAPFDVVTVYQYDAMGNLTGITLPNSSEKDYSYDALGRRIFEVIDPGDTQLFTQTCWDAIGNVIRTIQGEGLTSHNSSLCTVTRANTVHLITEYAYDASGRLLSIDYDEADSTTGRVAAVDVTYTYDRFGNRERMSYGGEVWQYAARKDGLLETVCADWDTTNEECDEAEVTYAYDDAGNRVTVSLGTILNTHYVLDSAGRLNCISGGTTPDEDCLDTVDVIYNYINPTSQLASVSLPNGVTASYAYDPVGRLRNITYQGAGTQQAQFDYPLDGRGNRIGANEMLRLPTSGSMSNLDSQLIGSDPDQAGTHYHRPSTAGQSTSDLLSLFDMSRWLQPQPTVTVPEASLPDLSTNIPNMQTTPTPEPTSQPQETAVPTEEASSLPASVEVGDSCPTALALNANFAAALDVQDSIPTIAQADASIETSQVDYHAVLSEDGIQFTYSAAGIPESKDVVLSLASIEQGENTQTSSNDALSVVESQILWQNCNNVAVRSQSGGVYEIASLHTDYVQFAYLFPQPVFPEGNGDLVVAVDLDTEMDVYSGAQGILLFDGAGGGVQITDALAIDANGNEIPVSIMASDHKMLLTISGEWLAQAAYPVLLDPIIKRWEPVGVSQLSPAIAYSQNANQALVVYLDQNSSGQNTVRAKLVDAITSTEIADIAIQTTAAAYLYPDVVFNASGSTGAEYLVTYRKDNHIYTRRVDADTGVLIGSQVNPISTINNRNVQSLSLAFDTTTDTGLIVWTERATDTSPLEVRGLLLNDDGTASGSNFMIASHTTNDQREAVATFDATLDKFVVAWEEHATVNEIIANTVTLTGTVGTTAFAVSTDTGSDSMPAIAYSASAGKILIAWESGGSNRNVEGRTYQYNNGSYTAGSVFVISSATENEQQISLAPELDAGGWIATWRKTVVGTPNNDNIALATISSSLSINVMSASAESVNESNPEVIGRSDGGALLAFEEWNSSNTSRSLTLIANAGSISHTEERSWNYIYDGLDRLKYACSNWDGSDCLGTSFVYTYDGAGNLTQLEYWDRSALPYHRDTVHFLYNDANQIECLNGTPTNNTCGDTQDTAYTYDAFGNLLNDGVRSYTYDSAQRLHSVTFDSITTTYTYNGDGDRVAQTDGTTTTTYTLDVASPLTQVLASTTGGVTTTYTYGLGLVSQTTGSTTRYFAYDGLGSVRQVLNSSGSIEEAQTFDPYGNLYRATYSSNQTSLTSFGWTGEQRDSSGLTYLRARYYNPKLGRFTQIDPFDGALAAPASLNQYGYVHGNPTNYVDPSGLSGTLPPCLICEQIMEWLGIDDNPLASTLFGTTYTPSVGSGGVAKVAILGVLAIVVIGAAIIFGNHDQPVFLPSPLVSPVPPFREQFPLAQERGLREGILSFPLVGPQIPPLEGIPLAQERGIQVMDFTLYQRDLRDSILYADNPIFWHPNRNGVLFRPDLTGEFTSEHSRRRDFPIVLDEANYPRPSSATRRAPILNMPIWEPHHIVPIDDPSFADTYIMFERFGIQRNSAANGVWLPFNNADVALVVTQYGLVQAPTAHTVTFTDVYIDELLIRMEDINWQIPYGPLTQQEYIYNRGLVLNELHNIANELLSGVWP